MSNKYQIHNGFLWEENIGFNNINILFSMFGG